MNIKSEWLVRGYFQQQGEKVGQLNATAEIRNHLQAALNRPLDTKSFPVGANWRHTYWFRDKGEADYLGAQFFLSIDEDCPVLSLGVTVEKGLEGTVPQGVGSQEVMDRNKWVWPRLIDRCGPLLHADVPAIATAVGRSVSVRARCYSGGRVSSAASKTFTFADGNWYQRHVGTTSPEEVIAHLQHLDQLTGEWVNLFFSLDYGPSEVENRSPGDIAGLLLPFQAIRHRLTTP